MAKPGKAVPEGFHTVTPELMVRHAAKAIEFYKKAFGAQELMRMASPDGQIIMHSELKIGNSVIFVGDEFPGGGKSPESAGAVTASFHLYVEDVDAAYNKAIEAGAKAKMPVSEMFWGDRYGRVIDPFGHEWGIATHVEDLTPDEIAARAEAYAAKMAQKQ